MRPESEAKKFVERKLDALFGSGFNDDDLANEKVLAFFDNLIAFVIEHRSNSELVTAQVNNWYDRFFSHSDSPSNQLSLLNQLRVMIRVTKIPELQGPIGQALVGSFVYSLTFCDEEAFEKLVEQLEHEETHVLLDIIDQCKTLASNAAANGSWSEDGFDRIQVILEDIYNNNPSMLVHYATELSLERIESEYNLPSLSVVTNRTNRYGARVGETFSEEEISVHQLLNKKIQIIDNQYGGRVAIIPLSSDTIGLFDHAKILQGYASFQLSQLNEGTLPTWSQSTLDSLEEVTDNESKIPDPKLGIVLIRLIHAVIESGVTQDVEIGKQLSELLPYYTATEWEEFLRVDRVLSAQEDIEQKLRNEKQQEIEDHNMALSKTWYRDVLTYATEKLSTLGDTAQNELFQESLVVLKENINSDSSGDLDRAFTAAREISNFFAHQNDSTLHLRHQALLQAHDSNWESLRKWEIDRPRYTDEHRAYVNYMQKVRTEREVLMEAVKTYAKFVQADRDAQCTQVHFVSIEEINKDQTVIPFGHESEHLGLLIQHLHNPELRARVESDFGISFLAIPFRYQVQFLKVLVSNTSDEYSLLKERVSELNPQDRINYVVAHLACGESEAYKELIVTAAQNFPRNIFTHILEKYKNLVVTTEAIRASLRTILVDDVSVTEAQLEYISHNVLTTANDFLKNSFEESPETTVATLKNINEQQLFLLNSFKSLKESGMGLKLEDILSSTFEVKHGDSISSDDITTMRSIYSQNQAGVGAHNDILAHFDARVQNPDARFYIFKWQGKIQSFVAFEPSKRVWGALEATSFNVDPSARGYKIGEAMLEEAIAKEAKDHVLEGECYVQLSISAKYIETGWVAESTFTEPGKVDGTTDRLLNIVRDDVHNGVYWGKSGATKEQIVRRENIPHNVIIRSASTQEELPFAEHLDGDHVMTRMFFDQNTRKYFAVFEPYRKKPVERPQRVANEDVSEPEEVGV